MPADDWALAQGTVDFRNEERMAANRGHATDRGPDGRYLYEESFPDEPVVDVARKIVDRQAFTDVDAVRVAEAFLEAHT